MNPKAIRDAAKKADQMIAELAAQASKAPADSQPPVPSAEPEDASATPPTSVDGGEPETTTPAVSESTEPTTPPTPAPNKEVADLKAQLDSAMQQWKSLQGMWRSEKQRADELAKLLATMASSQQGGAAPEEHPSPTKSLITEGDVKEFGADLIDMVGRKVTEMVGMRLDALEARIAKLSEGLGTVETRQVQTAEQEFYSDLAKAVPNWKAINSDPEFLEWLNVPDELSGELRDTLLKRAGGSLDAKRVAAIMKLWLDETRGGTEAPVADAAGAGEAPSGAPSAPTPSLPLEKMVAPGATRGSAPPVKAKGKVYSRKDISDFYAQKARLSKEEADKIERDIFRAQHEGRILA